MKNIYIIIATILLSASTFAQAPEKMSYQAVVRDAANTLITNQAVGMQISILQGGDLANPGPIVVYSETQTPTTNANGLVTLEIGTGAIVSGIFANIDWSASPYFIQTGTDPTGGTTYTTLTSTSQLMSVPFALHTKHAANGLPAGGTDGQILAINVSGVPEWTDPLTSQTYYEDTDDDGYGDINSAVVAASAPNGYVINNTDCNDADIAINPDTIWYLDSDGDNYAVSSVTQCDSPGIGYTTTVLPLSDCDDTRRSTRPGAYEFVGDGIDNNCDGRIDEFSIGAFMEGGIVFYVDSSGQHGLVVSLHDIIDPLTQEVSLHQWADISCDINIGTSTEFGSGQANTTKIVNDACQMTDGLISAAEACDSYVLSSYYFPMTYDDWFLPSKDELSLIASSNLTNYGTIFQPLNSNVPSSSEYGDGAQVYLYQGWWYYWKKLSVRPVRAF